MLINHHMINELENLKIVKEYFFSQESFWHTMHKLFVIYLVIHILLFQIRCFACPTEFYRRAEAEACHLD